MECKGVVKEGIQVAGLSNTEKKKKKEKNIRGQQQRPRSMAQNNKAILIGTNLMMTSQRHNGKYRDDIMMT